MSVWYTLILAGLRHPSEGKLRWGECGLWAWKERAVWEDSSEEVTLELSDKGLMGSSKEWERKGILLAVRDKFERTLWEEFPVDHTGMECPRGGLVNEAGEICRTQVQKGLCDWAKWGDFVPGAVGACGGEDIKKAFSRDLKGLDLLID